MNTLARQATQFKNQRDRGIQNNTGSANNNGDQEAQILKEEVETLSNIIEQMKTDMQGMMAHVKMQANQQQKVLEQTEMEAKQLNVRCRNLERQCQRLKEERDKLAEISADLRADLNRQQRLVNEFGNHISNPKQQQFHTSPQKIQKRQDSPEGYILSSLQGDIRASQGGMFDDNILSS